MLVLQCGSGTSAARSRLLIGFFFAYSPLWGMTISGSFAQVHFGRHEDIEKKTKQFKMLKISFFWFFFSLLSGSGFAVRPVRSKVQAVVPCSIQPSARTIRIPFISCDMTGSYITHDGLELGECSTCAEWFGSLSSILWTRLSMPKPRDYGVALSGGKMGVGISGARRDQIRGHAFGSC